MFVLARHLVSLKFASLEWLLKAVGQTLRSCPVACAASAVTYQQWVVYTGSESSSSASSSHKRLPLEGCLNLNCRNASKWFEMILKQLSDLKVQTSNV